MKNSNHKKRNLELVITILAVLFIVIGFFGIYMNTAVYKGLRISDITQVILLIIFFMMILFRELWKQEIQKLEYTKKYTLLVYRKG